MKTKFFLLVFVIFKITFSVNSQETGELIVYGIDQYSYKTIKIGNQVWMAENMSFEPSVEQYYAYILRGIVFESWVYNNDKGKASLLGRLYTYESANNVCPYGWHLPTISEINILIKSVSGDAYEALIPGGNSGFLALFGGRYFGTYEGESKFAYFWLSSEDSNLGNFLCIIRDMKQIGIGSCTKSCGLSVRCLKDNVSQENK
jgi:uncharacterized protein (TIGR02145 family)